MTALMLATWLAFIDAGGVLQVMEPTCRCSCEPERQIIQGDLLWRSTPGVEIIYEHPIWRGFPGGGIDGTLTPGGHP